MNIDKSGFEDLAALFLPDISNQNLSGGSNHHRHQDHGPPSQMPSVSSTPTQPNPSNSGHTAINNNSSPQSVLRAKAEQDQHQFLSPPNSNSQSSFANFLSNNDFITWKLPPAFGTSTTSVSDTPGITQATGAQAQSSASDTFDNHAETHHVGHYSSFVPPEASLSQLHHHHHGQYFGSGSSQAGLYSKQLDPNWLTGQGELDSRMFGDPKYSLGYPQHTGQDQMDFMYQPQPQLPPNFTSDYDSVARVPVAQYQNGATAAASDEIGSKKSGKRKYQRKRNKKVPNTSGIQIDYSSAKLIKLLDLRSKKLNQDYKLLDQKGNEISVDFRGFLSGRALTNDYDNSKYILGLFEEKNEGSQIKNKTIRADPKVISCYRRNFIQVSLNFKLLGFKDYSEDDSKILKLQTSEYGYNITRVVKWFKIEITALSTASAGQPVSLVINEDSKERKEEGHLITNKDDHVVSTPISSTQQIITLNNSQITDGNIDTFFTIKKLQFKNATSNNGKFLFQNYYYLKIKLSAIVADLYYDDYIDEDFSVANSDNSRNEINLFELQSEPMIVRGRNPSFYAERKDMLVKGRLPSLKSSYLAATKVDTGDPLDFMKIDYNSSESTTDRDPQANNEGTEEGDEEEEDEDEGDDDFEGDALENENENDAPAEEPKKPKSTTPVPATSQTKSIPPGYNPNPSSLNLETIGKDGNHYKYFPISNVYYLPPINFTTISLR
ncbi:p53-like transcription factor [Yamadazyma tenuis ATCC 10573]|uniref:p53-like transcription factor n=1 Tax=Candida tenuis (strain ATCC 10573 / BCRC 21748 / CBS 615 / JCM 9827 / NBRC 10315 / NRRL Y-1498 / VKM Y-70) TaxID=590646 RepID=G3BBG0_CANTC|nr:p53-like transcription factor [Yamadazyma tenuis ATCC 10573]EGV62180.1 p53-like transcription factor [Yamadazyma tenuis ATCC 10573]